MREGWGSIGSGGCGEVEGLANGVDEGGDLVVGEGDAGVGFFDAAVGAEEDDAGRAGVEAGGEAEERGGVSSSVVVMVDCAAAVVGRRAIGRRLGRGFW